MNRTKLLSLILLTQLLVVSCSNSYGSKGEARNARDEWLKDGVTIQVVARKGYPSFYDIKETRTRWCDEEKESRQFVCKKKLVSNQKASKTEWDKAKTHYTYFHY